MILLLWKQLIQVIIAVFFVFLKRFRAPSYVSDLCHFATVGSNSVPFFYFTEYFRTFQIQVFNEQKQTKIMTNSISSADFIGVNLLCFALKIVKTSGNLVRDYSIFFFYFVVLFREYFFPSKRIFLMMIMGFSFSVFIAFYY